MGKCSTIENVEKFCSEQNIKLTTKRKKILMSLLNSEKDLDFALWKLLPRGLGFSPTLFGEINEINGIT